MSEILRQQQNKVYRVTQEPLHTRCLATEMPWQVSFAPAGIQAYSRPTRCHSSAEVRLPFVAQFTSWRRQASDSAVAAPSQAYIAALEKEVTSIQEGQGSTSSSAFLMLGFKKLWPDLPDSFLRISRNVSDVEVTNVHVTIGVASPRKKTRGAALIKKKLSLL